MRQVSAELLWRPLQPEAKLAVKDTGVLCACHMQNPVTFRGRIWKCVLC